MKPDLRDLLIREIGCIACRKHNRFTPCEKHHLLTTGLHGNGERRGEHATIGLCQHHHRGRAAVGSESARLWVMYVGPSYADAPKAFRAEFGSDDELLDYQNELIEKLMSQTVGHELKEAASW